MNTPSRPSEDPVFRELEKIRAETDSMCSTLRNPAVTRLVLVVNPDRLSVLEASRTVEALSRIGVRAWAAIVNKVPEGTRGLEENVALRLGVEKIVLVPAMSSEPAGLRNLKPIARILDSLVER